MKKILIKTKKIKLIFVFFVLFLIFIVMFYSKKIQAIEKNETYSNTLKKNVNPIKIEEILEQNTSSNVTEEMNIKIIIIYQKELCKLFKKEKMENKKLLL